MSERAYMAHMGDPLDGAALVFASSAREAKKLAWPVLKHWTAGWYTDLRVRWLRGGAEHLREKDGPHVVEAPDVCVDCQMWHAEPYDDAGRCVSCADARAMEALT